MKYSPEVQAETLKTYIKLGYNAKATMAETGINELTVAKWWKAITPDEKKQLNRIVESTKLLEVKMAQEARKEGGFIKELERNKKRCLQRISHLIEKEESLRTLGYVFKILHEVEAANSEEQKLKATNITQNNFFSTVEKQLNDKFGKNKLNSINVQPIENE